MHRALIIATLTLCADPRAAVAQPASALHITVVVADPDHKPTPVPRHVLLISDNPASAPPRQVVTGQDGTADVKLRPGNYTVESDQPLVFHGKAYQWTQFVDIAAGRDAVLELTAQNAEITASASAPDSAAPLESDPLFVLPQWEDSVVALWTPTAHASGFVVDARGLVVTNQRVVGTGMSAEVQLAPAVKVAARVLAADPARDVAVLRIDQTVAALVPPLPTGCTKTARTTVTVDQKLFTISAPLLDPKGITSGTASGVEAHSITADFVLPSGSAGGPVFNAGGEVIGITSVADATNESRRAASRVVRIEDACEVLAAAEKKMKDSPAPDGTHLPVEPARSFPIDALKNAVQGRAGSLNPYQISSSDFDIAFITPVLVYAAQNPPEQVKEQERGTGRRTHDVEMQVMRPVMDFQNWSEYVGGFPPVLIIRVTPKAVEGFWTTVARGAARTQGVALPPISHAKSAFGRMRAFCGETEVTPIHRFKLEPRVSDEHAAVSEGLYVFDPGALRPSCEPVKLVLYSEKEPQKGDTRPVDPGVLQQIWRDFAAYREP